jgi:hypothetical protein
MASPIDAGKAFVEFIINDKKFSSQLAAIGAKMRKFSAIAAAAVAPIIAGFTKALSVFSQWGDQLDKVSARTGVAVESLSELSFAAERSGASLEDIEKAAAFMQRNGLDPRRIDEFANKIAGIEDPTERAQAAMEVFGRQAGRALLPMLKDLPELRKKARELGVTMSTEDATAAAKFADAVGDIKTQIKSLAFQMGAAIAGDFTEFVNWSAQALAWVIRFVREHPNMVKAVAAIAFGVGALSIALGTLSIAMWVITLHPLVLAVSALAFIFAGLVAWVALNTDAFRDLAKWFSNTYDWVIKLNPELATMEGILKSIAGIVKDVATTGFSFAIGKGAAFAIKKAIAGPAAPPAPRAATELQSRVSANMRGAALQPMGARAVSEGGRLAGPNIDIHPERYSSEMVRLLQRIANQTKEPGLLAGRG